MVCSLRKTARILWHPIGQGRCSALLEVSSCTLVPMGIPIYTHGLGLQSRIFQQPMVDLLKIGGRLL